MTVKYAEVIVNERSALDAKVRDSVRAGTCQYLRLLHNEYGNVRTVGDFSADASHEQVRGSFSARADSCH